MLGVAVIATATMQMDWRHEVTPDSEKTKVIATILRASAPAPPDDDPVLTRRLACSRRSVPTQVHPARRVSGPRGTASLFPFRRPGRIAVCHYIGPSS